MALRGTHIHANDVPAVNGELAPHCDAAAGTEWQIIHALVLRMLRIEAVDVHHDRHRRIANRQAADLPRGVEIALHAAWRDEQQVGDVVEAAADVVRRQQVIDADLTRQRVEGEQIADGVSIFGPAEAMCQRQLAEMWTRGFGAVQLGFKERGDAVVAGGVRTRHTRWRHRLRSQLANHLLPAVSACADVVDTSGVDDQAAALQPFVMTRGAVLLEDSGGRGGAAVAADAAGACATGLAVATAIAKLSTATPSKPL